MYHESLQANLFMGASAPLTQTSPNCVINYERSPRNELGEN